MTKRKIFALGFFDGVHLGHQALLERCCALARDLDAQPCAITFRQHPQAMFTKNPPKLLTTHEDRLQLLRQYAMAEVVSYSVTEETMSMPWQTFLQGLLEKGAVGFVCGADFRFGHQGGGDAEKLAAFCREKGLACAVVADQTLDGVRVSSTHIRDLLESGDMELAVKFLGHPHVLTGEVVPGRRIGRTIGVPTANILIPEGVITPRPGVYACTALVDGKTYAAVTNVGSRPTVGGHEVRAESWLQDFEGDLYGKTVTLHFRKFLRPEKKFETLEALRSQIQLDAAETYSLFK